MDETLFPMDFLRKNNKLLYLLSFDQNKVYSHQTYHLTSVFREWTLFAYRLLLLWAKKNTLRFGKTKPILLSIRYNWICLPYDAWPSYIYWQHLQNISPQASSHPVRSFFGFDIFFSFFIRGDFNVYGRKLINNIHSLRHSLCSLILVIFIMSLNIKYKAHKNTTNFSWGDSQSSGYFGSSACNHLILVLFH